MKKLNEFRTIIENTESLDELSTAHSLLTDIMAINDMNEKIKSLEGNLSAGGRAMFYFFASSLDPDEVIFAAEKLRGKMQRLREKEPKLDSNKEEL